MQNDGLVGLAADWVVVGAACAAVGDADIAKEGLAGRLVIVDAVVGADDGAIVDLVGKPDARRDVDLVAVVDVLRRAGAPAGDHQTGAAGGVEDGEVRIVGVEGLLVVITQAEVDVQLRR